MKVLTDTQISRKAPGKHLIRLSDGAVKGMKLAITPAGAKTFWLHFTSPVDGKRKQFRLGKYYPPHYTLIQARKDAANLRYEISQGKDPSIEARNRPQNLSNAGTVAELFKLYQQDLEMDNKLTSDMLGAYRLDIGPFIGDRLANTVTKFDIADLLAKIVNRGSIRKADIVRGYLHRAYNLGLKAETSPRWRNKVPNFELLYNPVSMVEKAGRSNPGNNVLSTVQVRQLWNDIGVTAMQADAALAIKLILSTGQRVMEVLAAEWNEFDLDKGTWTIPFERRKLRRRAKHHEPHLVPLMPLHLALLKELYQLTGSNRWLFPDRTRSRPRTKGSLRQTVFRFCNPAPQSTRESFKHFSPRDLRRTFKTLSGECGLSKEIRDRLQGHAFQDVGSKNYDRYDYWVEKQEAMRKWGLWLDCVIKRQSTSAPYIDLESPLGDP